MGTDWCSEIKWTYLMDILFASVKVLDRHSGYYKKKNRFFKHSLNFSWGCLYSLNTHALEKKGMNPLVLFCPIGRCFNKNVSSLTNIGDISKPLMNNRCPSRN